MAEFGEQLKRAREAKGMTQQTLADKVYVTRQAVSRWERGERYPDLVSLKMLSSVLEVSVDKLLDDGEMTAVVEKNPVIEKPIINNLAVALYALIAFCFGIRCVQEIPTVPFAWDISKNILASGGLYIYLELLVLLGESVLFLYGLWLVLYGKMNPQRTGIVVTGFFALEALKNIRNLILGAYSLDVFTVSVCMMIPYILGAVGAYCFFVRNDKHKCFAVVVDLAAAFGILRQLYTILMMNLIADHLVTGLHVLISVLVVMVYVLFIYQTAVLNRKRKSADILSSQNKE